MLSVVTAVRDLARLREISSVLIRHGFGEIVARAKFGKKPSEPESEEDQSSQAELLAASEKIAAKSPLGVRVRLVLEELGPSFIKLGQIASTRADVIPIEIINELKKLQDGVPPVPYEQIRDAVEESLGAPIPSLFVSFEQEPLATASIGQVHRAQIVTADGKDEEVVVKVQRPGVAPTVMRDLEILHMMAATIERALPESRIYSPVGLVQQFDRSITAELNFVMEAENGERFARNFEGNPHVRFPRVFKEWSSKHVLTQEFFDGRKIDRALQEGLDGHAVAKHSCNIVVQMIFEDGFFHADPHPGNIILLGGNEDTVVGVIDLGMVGRLSPEMRDRTVDFMVAAARKDPYAVADALYAIGRPTRKVDMREYRAHVAELAERYLGRTLKDIELSAMIRDIVRGALKFGIEIPPDFLMVGKALMTLEGIGRQLDPNLDIMAEISPHFIRIVRDRYSPERIGNELWRTAEQLSKVGYDLPIQAREVLDDLRLGRLTIKTEDLAETRAIDRAGKRVHDGIVVAALIGSGSYLLAASHTVEGALMTGFGVVMMAWRLLRR